MGIGPEMKIGILSVQGAVSEHLQMTHQAIQDLGRSGSAVVVKTKEQLGQVESLVIPGGESTAISRLIDKQGLKDLILERSAEGMPVLGTCAGCILMAKEGDEDVRKSDTRLLSLMDMKVVRNAYGRQRESFEASLDLEVFERPFPGIFIRAPAIARTWADCKPLGRLEEHIVMARQENLLAMTFHPELSHDSRVHQYFLDL